MRFPVYFHVKKWAGDRIDAIAWAQGMIKSDAVIVDTETTGLLDYKNVEVIELAVITMKGRVLYHSRFCPRYRIPQRTTAIHGITDEEVAHEPRFNEEFAKIEKILNGRVAVAFKSEFDKGVIERTCRRYKLEMPDCRWECAMHAYRAFQEAGRWLPLPDAQHTALGDCKATLKLLKRMAKG